MSNTVHTHTHTHTHTHMLKVPIITFRIQTIDTKGSIYN